MIVSYVNPVIELYADIDERGVSISDFDPRYDPTPYIKYRTGLATVQGKKLNYNKATTMDDFVTKCHEVVNEYCPKHTEVLTSILQSYTHIR